MSKLAKFVNNAMSNRHNMENFDSYNFTPIKIFVGYESVSAQLSMIKIDKGARYLLIIKSNVRELFEMNISSPIIDISQINLNLIFSYIDKYNIRALKIDTVVFVSPIWICLGAHIKNSKSLKYLWLNNVRLAHEIIYEPIIYTIFSSKLLVFLWNNSEINNCERDLDYTNKYLHKFVLIDVRSYLRNNIIIQYNMNIQLYNNTLHAIYLLLMANKRRIGIIGCLPKDVLFMILKNVWDTYRD